VFLCYPRITAVRCSLSEASDLVFGSVYFPYDNGSVDYITELEDVVGCLQGIIDKYSSSQFIFGGDFNMCNSSGHNNQETVSKLCRENHLTWLHHDACTFHNDTASRYSLLDHFVSSDKLVPPNGLFRILTEDDNLSDHYAILSHFTLTYTQTAIPDPQSDCSTRLDWKGADIDHYQLLLSNLLSDISLPVDALLCQDTLCNSHSDSLEWYYNKIIDCLLSASRQSVPVVKTGVQKHWWTPELDSLKQECIDICHLESDWPSTEWFYKYRAIEKEI